MIIDVIIVMIIAFIGAFVGSTIENKLKKINSKISFREAMDLVELPVVTFYNNDKKLNFLLDTGSNISYINSSIIPSLDYERINKKTSVIGMEGNKTDNELCEMSITYNDQVFEDEFVIADLDKAFNTIKQESGVQIHGILGSKFFEKYRYVLNFKELTAYIK